MRVTTTVFFPQSKFIVSRRTVFALRRELHGFKKKLLFAKSYANGFRITAQWPSCKMNSSKNVEELKAKYQKLII